MSRKTLWTIAGAATALALGLWVLAVERNWIRFGAQAARLHPAGPAVRQFLGPLADGAPLATGKILRAWDLDRGGLPLLLETAGHHRVGVTVLKHDPTGTQGVANTTGLSIFLGNGGAQTVEEEAQAARALATALADREREAPLPGLLTLSERQKLPGGARLSVPLD